MKPSILLIGEAVTLTHVIRPTMLADMLHAAGYTVTLAADPRFDALLGPRPYRRIPLKSSIDAKTSTDLLKQNRPLFDVATFGQYVREDIRLMRLLQPDVVIGDMRQSLAISARLMKIPYVNTINVFWSTASDEALELVDHPIYRLFGRGLGERVFDMLVPLGSMLMSLPINIAAMNHGLPPVGPGVRETFCAGDYVIHPDIPDLYALRPLPAGHQCIGPLNWSPEIPPPTWWDEVPNDKPIVYVNLGSSGEPASLDAILAALMDLPVTVMVATTNRRTVASVPGKVFVAEYLQGEAAAARSQIMINNAGASSGYQALTAGVPFLGIPSNADQLVFMRCMTRAGAGICLLENEVTSAAVKDAIAHMLASPSFGATAQAIKTKIAAVDTPAIIVKLIEDILANPLRNAG